MTPHGVVVRSPDRPRGKWHLPASLASAWTICDEPTSGWDTAPRSSIDPRDLCARCLSQTA